MSYLVLARKYRPSYFDEVIGQDHITELLKKAVESNRVSHAYLFCGPRGIGKTSCARILAKSLNCEKGPTLKPCGKCVTCSEISKGNSFDVLEIDGASNRGIDEIRSLRENVKFAPNYGRYKIYIVDEVHMLTTEAFNALLKTLEEPPEHVKFIFATTEPNKVPATIISRCQRFDFHRISIKDMTAVLSDICKKEKLKIDEDALFAIAKAAQGSLRDSLSILDQLSAVSDRGIKRSDVFSMMGLVETQHLFDLSDCIAEKNCAKTLNVFEEIISQGKDVKQLIKDLVEHFRNLMIIKVGGKKLGKLVDYPISLKEALLAQTQRISLKDIILSIEAFVHAQEVSRITESLRIPLEVAFAKLTFNPGELKADDHFAVDYTRTNSKEETTAVVPEPEKKQVGVIDIDDADDEGDDELAIGENLDSDERVAKLSFERIKKSWNALTFAVSKKKMSVATFLQQGSPYELKGRALIIAFPKGSTFAKEALEHGDNLKEVESIFSDKLGTSVSLEFILVEDFKENAVDDPKLKETLETFKGKVVNQWHSE